MRDRDLLLLLGAGALLLAGGGVAVVRLTGARVSSSTTGDDGQIAESPDELLAQASSAMGRAVGMDAYALARMAASEGAAEAVPRMHVAINDAAELGRSVLDTVTTASPPRATGGFGPQFVSSPRVVRRYSTAKDPTADLVAIAEQVIADHEAGIDPTDGAVKFADARSFGVQEGTGSFEATVDRWAAEGLAPANVPGYSTDFYVFRRG